MHLMHILFVNTSYLEYGHLAVHIELLFYASPRLDSWAKAMNKTYVAEGKYGIGKGEECMNVKNAGIRRGSE